MGLDPAASLPSGLTLGKGYDGETYPLLVLDTLGLCRCAAPRRGGGGGGADGAERLDLLRWLSRLDRGGVVCSSGIISITAELL